MLLCGKKYAKQEGMIDFRGKTGASSFAAANYARNLVQLVVFEVLCPFARQFKRQALVG